MGAIEFTNKVAETAVVAAIILAAAKTTAVAAVTLAAAAAETKAATAEATAKTATTAVSAEAKSRGSRNTVNNFGKKAFSSLKAPTWAGAFAPPQPSAACAP